jgi:hypothetical protein
MTKKIAIFMTLLLMASSVTLADSILPGSVYQQQTFSVGDMVNPGMGIVLALTHGDACATASQDLFIDNIQSSPCNAKPCSIGPCCGSGLVSIDMSGRRPGPGGPGGCGPSCDVEAVQTQDADMLQDASAKGNCGIININTFMDAGGYQDQFIGFSTDPKSQVQTLGLAAQQVLARSDGPGGGEATNEAVLDQTQAGSNAAGSVYEGSTIDAVQTSKTAGGANSTTALATTLMANTTQTQNVY